MGLVRAGGIAGSGVTVVPVSIILAVEEPSAATVAAVAPGVATFASVSTDAAGSSTSIVGSGAGSSVMGSSAVVLILTPERF